MDLIERFRRSVYTALGLDPDRRMAIDRLALYRARVVTCAADGATVDVSPEDPRLAPAAGVPVRVGIPGATAVVAEGALVLIGWERGDPSRIYAVPAWEMGASVSKLVLNAGAIYLGAEAGAKRLVTTDDFDGHVHAAGTLVAPNGAVTGATAGAAPAAGTTHTRAT